MSKRDYAKDSYLSKGELVMSIILAVIYGLTLVVSFLLMFGVFGHPIPALFGNGGDMGFTTMVFAMGVANMVPTLFMYFAASNFNLKKGARIALYVVGIACVVGIGIFYTMLCSLNGDMLGGTANVILYVVAPWVSLIIYALVLLLGRWFNLFGHYVTKFIVSIVVLWLSTFIAVLLAFAVVCLILWVVYKLIKHSPFKSSDGGSSGGSGDGEEVITVLENGSTRYLKYWGQATTGPYNNLHFDQIATAYRDDLGNFWITLDGSNFLPVNRGTTNDCYITKL